MTKPVLYTFAISVWASAPELAIRELGYAADDVEKKVINLMQGENFAPAFLRINPEGTLPTLTADGHAYTSTADVTSYLVKHAPKSVRPGTAFISKIHQDALDPNFPLLLARSDQELQQKATTFAMDFIRNRQDALEHHASQPNVAQYEAFYESKTASNGSVLTIYNGNASDDDKQVFFHQSTTHWNTLKWFISEELVGLLPDTTFLGGDHPGEDDFHLAAWLARIAFVAAGGNEQNSVQAIENGFGVELHPKISAYLGAWSSRESWKEVYGDGLH